ncbi:acyl-CoA thioester hydrolase [Natranaerovirga pectinivora]|uniref:Acyl-CoA thioester hydrolase n=1 Tax=Natranaerovirga pectinivora TaxID=682400 RepID=A0A4R3MKW8_9FIRM|nr:thioesterase family protein [Natranaerovirga pectinivora]TCT15059.1 acyl-CoA thioester hydrolase [Natranaerovirga pectinivora]
MISESKVIVRYAETDQMGVVHHSNYPIWYEVARTDLIKKLGMTYTDIEKMGLLFPLLELKSKYIEPALYEDELIIKTSLKSFKGIKIVFEYSIYRNDGEKAINIGETIHALVTKEFKPVNVKKEFPELFKLLEDAVEKE